MNLVSMKTAWGPQNFNFKRICPQQCMFSYVISKVIFMKLEKWKRRDFQCFVSLGWTPPALCLRTFSEFSEASTFLLSLQTRSCLYRFLYVFICICSYSYNVDSFMSLSVFVATLITPLSQMAICTHLWWYLHLCSFLPMWPSVLYPC